MKYTTDTFPKYKPNEVGDGTRRNRADYLQPMGERFDYNPPKFPMVLDETANHRERLLRIAKLVVWMQVDKSVRWRKIVNDAGKTLATYCDHYAWDFLNQCLDAYPPFAALLWWNKENEAAALAGEPIPVVYPRYNVKGTVVEYGATGAAKWVAEFAEDFGWQTFDDDKALQVYLDENSTVGIVIAQKRDRSRGASHVTVALPSLVAKALRYETDDDGVLQTEAGGTNRQLTRRTWYAADWKAVHFLALPPSFFGADHEPRTTEHN